MYKVFDTMAGVYIDAESEVTAKTIYSTLINNHVKLHVNNKVLSQTQVWAADKQFAELSCINFFGEAKPLEYCYTVFNLTGGAIRSRCFISPDMYLIKVLDNELLEIYGVNFTDSLYSTVSYNLETKAPLFGYKYGNGEIEKYDSSTGQLLAKTFGGDFPAEVNSLLDQYPDVKATATQWGERSYGYMVEYKEPGVMIPNPLYEEQVNAATAEIKSRTNVIIEVPDEQGLITTQVVDTTDW